jgi:RNase P/RNase MRP subunit p29
MPFRNHYIKRNITEINPEVDLKIKIMGFVVDKKENTFVIDDGNGKVKIFTDEASLLDNININQLIRVFGSTLPTEDGFEIKADAIQGLSNLNINLYKEVEELYNKVGV